MQCRDEAIFEQIVQLLNLDRASHDSTPRAREALRPDPPEDDATSQTAWGDFRVFVRALELIRHCLDPDEILRTAVSETRTYLDLDRVLVLRIDSDLNAQFVAESRRDDRWSHVVSAVGNVKDTANADRGATLDLTANYPTADDLNATSEPERHSRLEAVSLSYLARFEVKAVALAPILCRELTWGILIAARRQEGLFCSRAHETLQQFGLTIGSALDHAEQLEQTRSQTRKLATTLRALQQTQTQLIQNEKMASLGQLVAGIAHELNNPVNFIYGNVSYIRDYTEDLLDTIDAYQAEFEDQDPLAQQLGELEFDFIRQDLPRLVTSMHNGITRIRKIVSSLRTFSRLDEAEQKTIDIHTGLDSALLLLRHRCRAIEHLEDVRIECHYGDLPPVTCYPASLNQVFVNILTNAFDALASVKDRSPKISLATTRLEENCVAIAFRDNGCGIPPEDLPHIFNPFFTTKPPGKGTGLGLSVSYQIVVDNHEGQFFCDSELGGGTTFTIELPIDAGF